MSAAPLRSSAPLRAPAPTRATPQHGHLRPVVAPEHARTLAPFAWLCVAIVLLSLGSVLALNTTMAEGAYQSRDLKIEIADLHQQRATALIKLESNSAPGALASRAQSLGMVPADKIGFITLSTGDVLEAGGR